MTNALYPKGREGFLVGDISWTTDTVKAVLVDTGLYSFNAAHDNLDDIPSGARVATSAALTGKTATDGVADADDLALAAVTGSTVEAVVLYVEAGTEATSRLIAYIDTATGLPVTPNGGTVNVIWDNAGNKIFKL